MSFRILVVDDKVNVSNTQIYEAIDYLKRVGYEVLTADNPDDGYRLVFDGHPDIILLDIHFPGKRQGEDGVALCKAIRSNKEPIPIILISSVYTATADIVRGIDAGADNYITLPFAPEAILAHVRANLLPPVLIVDDRIIVEVNERRLWKCDGSQWQEERLQPLQFVMLLYLIINANRTLTRSMIKDRVFNHDVDNQVLTVYVANLNKKLGRKPNGDRYIRAVHDIGYRFEGDPVNSSRQQLRYSCGDD